MTIALTLLVTALQLKLALLGLPVEYKSTVDQMMPMVETAISTANAEIAKGGQVVSTPVVVQTTPVVVTTTPTPVVQPIISQPTFGSVTPIKIMKEIIVKNDKNEIVNTVTIPAGALSAFLNVNYKVDGVSVLETITATTDENVSRVFNKNERTCSQSVMGGPKDDCSINYLYRVTTPGPHSVTFTVGETTKTIEINVES